MNDTKPTPARSPKGALTFRVLAIGVILYILADLLLAYFKGGEGAPELTLILIAAVVLGGGAVFLSILTWKAWKKDTEEKRENENEG